MRPKAVMRAYIIVNCSLETLLLLLSSSADEYPKKVQKGYKINKMTTIIEGTSAFEMPVMLVWSMKSDPLMPEKKRNVQRKISAYRRAEKAIKVRTTASPTTILACLFQSNFWPRR
jgi:hypothetical protein